MALRTAWARLCGMLGRWPRTDHPWLAVLAPVSLVVIVSALAVLIPASGATRLDPVAALRRD